VVCSSCSKPPLTLSAVRGRSTAGPSHSETSTDVRYTAASLIGRSRREIEVIANRNALAASMDERRDGPRCRRCDRAAILPAREDETQGARHVASADASSRQGNTRVEFVLSCIARTREEHPPSASASAAAGSTVWRRAVPISPPRCRRRAGAGRDGARDQGAVGGRHARYLLTDPRRSDILHSDPWLSGDRDQLRRRGPLLPSWANDHPGLVQGSPGFAKLRLE